MKKTITLFFLSFLPLLFLTADAVAVCGVSEFEDFDGDGVNDDTDNCFGVCNSDQADTNADLEGDACDTDDDGDGIDDDTDNCPLTENVTQGDVDADLTGDACDTEVCDGIDNDGDLTIDEGFADTDVDGTADCMDTEECDSLDNDGDGQTDEDVTTTFYEDADGDGFGNPDESTDACSLPDGYVTDDTDCDDTNETAAPDGTETCEDGIDQDCDGEDAACDPIETCNDEIDNDDDGLIDCADIDCDADSTCASISALDDTSSGSSSGCALRKTGFRVQLDFPMKRIETLPETALSTACGHYLFYPSYFGQSKNHTNR